MAREALISAGALDVFENILLEREKVMSTSMTFAKLTLEESEFVELSEAPVRLLTENH